MAIAIGLRSVFAAVAASLLRGPAYNAAGLGSGAFAIATAQARTPAAQTKDSRFFFMADPFFTVRAFMSYKPRPVAWDCQDDEKILIVFS
jgi:hypothetical protein